MNSVVQEHCVAEPRKAETCKTGVSGLDEILCGGLPAHRLYLVQGQPGVGKTTLAMQYLMEGARNGEQGLYITLSETKEELETIAQSHGWSLENIHLFELSAIEERLNSSEQNTLFHPAEIELNQTTEILLDEIRRVNPVRLVFDSLSEMRLLAQDPLRYRRQMLAFKQFFATRQCTVLLLDDKTTTQADLHIHSIAHGVISLEKLQQDYGTERRRINIVKMRGVNFRGGFHDYIITTGGIVTFPRLVASEHRQNFPAETLSTGIGELDSLLGGGLDRGTSNLLLGPAGTGKSTICSQYAYASAERGEKVLIYTFDENLRIAQARATGLGIPVEKHLQSGMIRNLQIDPAEMSPGELAYDIVQAVKDEDFKVVIIDSLNGFMKAMPEERFLTMHLHELLTYLAQQGVITIMTLAQHGVLGDMQTPADVTYLADTVVVLRYFEVHGEVKKALSIIKKRSGFHETTIRELVAEPNAIRVGPPLNDFQGILTGVPMYYGQAGEMLQSE